MNEDMNGQQMNGAPSNPSPYSWTPYQGNTGTSNQPGGNAAGGYTPYEPTGSTNYTPYTQNNYQYQYQPKTQKPKKERRKRQASRGLVIAICVVLAILLAFGSAWVASSLVASSALNEKLLSITKSGQGEQGSVTVGENNAVERVDTSDLKSDRYDCLADLVEDVSHSLVTLSTSMDYATGAVIGESEDSLYILTSYHVVAAANTVSLFFGGESEHTFTPTLVGNDSDTDTTLIKVAKEDLGEELLKDIRIATLGNSTDLILGDVAVAFSSPMGYYNSPSLGTISGKERSVSFSLNNTAVTISMIQTDAAANTSGVLFNGRGEIIGMTVNMTIEGSEGISFAVPSDTIRTVMDQLIEQGYVTKPYIGFSGYDAMKFYPQMSPVSWAEYYKLPNGILVASVNDDSPAQKAGLAIYDLITTFNGEAISDMDQLKELLNACEVGQKVTMTVLRGYTEGAEPQMVDLEIEIGQKPY